MQLSDVLSSIAKRGETETLLDTALTLLAQCNAVIQEQGDTIASLRRQLFGRRSEKISSDQLSLFASVLAMATAAASPEQTASSAEDAADADPTNAEPGSQGDDDKPKKDDDKGKKDDDKGKKPRQTRRPVEPTKTVKIPLSPEERACPICGSERCVIGHARTIVIEYTPPKIDVVEYLREKVACKPCEGEVAVAPQPN